MNESWRNHCYCRLISIAWIMPKILVNILHIDFSQGYKTISKQFQVLVPRMWNLIKKYKKFKTKNFFKGCSHKLILSSWLVRKCHRKIMVILENLKNFLYIKADIAQMLSTGLQFKKDYTPPTKNHKALTAKRWRLLGLNSVGFLDTIFRERNEYYQESLKEAQDKRDDTKAF